MEVSVLVRFESLEFLRAIFLIFSRLFASQDPQLECTPLKIQQKCFWRTAGSLALHQNYPRYGRLKQRKASPEQFCKSSERWCRFFREQPFLAALGTVR